MIIADQFIFIHLHKSGGTFFNEGLIENIPTAAFKGYHLPRRYIPPERAMLPVLGFVRNPWSFYVSWYSFQQSLANPNALFRLLSTDGNLNFKQTIFRLLNLKKNGELLRQILERLPERYGTSGLNVPRAAFAEVAARNCGFYSSLYSYMYFGGSGELTVGRMESMRNVSSDFFRKIGFNAPAGLMSYLESAAPRNTSRHSAYTDYYDHELRELVAERDCVIVDKYAYKFGED